MHTLLFKRTAHHSLVVDLSRREEAITGTFNQLTRINLYLEVRMVVCQLCHSLNTSTLIQTADTHSVSIRKEGQSRRLVWISLVYKQLK